MNNNSENSAKGKALILVDESNLYYGFKKQSWELDYKKFYQWLHEEFNPLDVYVFSGIVTKKMFFDKHSEYHTLGGFIKWKKDKEMFVKNLKSIGYKVKTKPVSSLYDNTIGAYKRKCNFDVEITIIAMDKIAEYQELVLCSGDGDFIKLIKYAKGKHKKTTIIAHGDRLNKDLAITANRKITFQSIKTFIEKKKELP
ncbi:MAG: NYN domain-containing protein [Candidatus Omnitrophota bacterium]